jgi:hypothetical protein
MLSLLLVLVGCGNPCQDYVDAAEACVTDYSEANGGEAVDLGLDGYCDTYTSSTDGDALLVCSTDAYNANDCSTTEGYSQASEDVLACIGA